MVDAKNKKEKPAKPKYNMWQNSMYMISLAWRHEWTVLALYILQAVFAVGSNLVNLYVSPAILSAVENRVPFSNLILTIAFFIGLIMLFAAVQSYIGSNTLYGRVYVRSCIISALNDKAATTSFPNTEDDRFIKLQAKAGEAVSNNLEATEAVWGTLTSLLQNLLGFGIYVFMLSSLDPLMLLVILATALIGYFIGKYINGYGYRHREEEAEYQKTMSYIDDRARDYAAAKDIRLFGLRPWFEEIYEKALNAYAAFHKRSARVYIWGNIADLVLAFIRNGAAYAYLIARVLNDGLDASQFLLYFSAVGGFSGWVSGLLGGFSALHRQSLDLSTVRECLEYPEPFRFEGGEPLLPECGKTYEIRLEDVTFRYPGTEKNIFSHLNLTLKPGEKLAVVGLNGAGKTTLVKLICGFYDPTEGRVLLNGRDIRAYNRRDYYLLFSAVFQSFSLLAGTIAANIAQNEDDIDMKRVEECAEKAGLREKIDSLPQKYETHLYREIYEDATMLSGGETQRLMLARALYKDAPVILLDEPTAALDPVAESDVYSRYNEMTDERSAVYISHRLASTRFCDRILFIEDGGIAEEGTHESLLRHGGRYAELFEIQSRYYREEADEIEREI